MFRWIHAGSLTKAYLRIGFFFSSFAAVSNVVSDRFFFHLGMFCWRIDGSITRTIYLNKYTYDERFWENFTCWRCYLDVFLIRNDFRGLILWQKFAQIVNELFLVHSKSSFFNFSLCSLFVEIFKNMKNLWTCDEKSWILILKIQSIEKCSFLARKLSGIM